MEFRLTELLFDYLTDRLNEWPLDLEEEKQMHNKRVRKQRRKRKSIEISQLESKEYKKDEKVLYFDKATNTHKPAVVLDVHHDDGPDAYYTIRIDEDNREKQTDSTRLSVFMQ